MHGDANFEKGFVQMPVNSFKKQVLYTLSSHAFMKTLGDFLKVICPTAIVSVGLIVSHRAQLPGWGWQVLALCVAAVVSFFVGVFMLMHEGDQP